MAGEVDACILILLTVIFPPAAVAFIAGCGADLCINILLTLLAYLPGFLHAIWLIMKRTDANEQYGYKNWTYSGMGEYTPRGGMPVSGKQTTLYGQPAQPQGEYAVGGTAAPPPTQAPVSQQPGRNVPPPPPPSSDVKYGYQVPPQAPVDQKVAVDQKQGEYQTPAQVPVDQKAINITPPALAPADQQQTKQTAQ